MTEVTLNETPSDIATAKPEFKCTDSKGRVYVLKRPGVLAHYRAVEMLGETSKNAVYMNMVLPLLWIQSIDGDHVPFPARKPQLEALIQRLGEEGVNAVLSAVDESLGPTDPDADREKLKN